MNILAINNKLHSIINNGLERPKTKGDITIWSGVRSTKTDGAGPRQRPTDITPSLKRKPKQ